MHDVFISYSTKELDMAEMVRNVLEKNDIPCWMAPRDIPGGSNYSKEIPAAIRGCQVFVLILSENAQSSQWVLRELDMAVNCGKVILPFMLENCPLNDEFNFLLTGAQRYAAYQKKAEAMENLIARIHGVTHGNKGEDAEPEALPQLEEKANPQTESKIEAVDAFVGIACCPACGSEQMTQLTKIGKYVGKEERIYSLGGIAACVVAFFVSVFVLGLTGSFLLWVLTCVLGTVLGNKLIRRATDKKVHRLRVRRHIHPYPFRCEKCDWVFLLNEDGSVPFQKKK